MAEHAKRVFNQDNLLMAKHAKRVFSHAKRGWASGKKFELKYWKRHLYKILEGNKKPLFSFFRVLKTDVFWRISTDS